MSQTINLWAMVALVAPLAVLAGIPAANADETRPAGIFEDQTDIGAVKHAGSALYNADTQEYHLAASGTNMWADNDEYHMVWKKMTGDFILRTRARLLGEGVDPHRKLGWIIRQSLDPRSPYVDVAVHGDGLTSLQFRRATGAETEQIEASITGADVIQLARKNGKYKMSVARFGDTFVSEELNDLDLGDDVYVGLFLCSHNPDVVERAVFRNVRIVVPAPDDLVPYRDYIGSNLEIMDVETGTRRIVHRVSDSFQAPNWTPDGNSLIYNRNGRLYRFDIESRTATVLDTDFATRNNNDHVLSFDGKRLGISHHAEEHDGTSIVYVLPATGGTPTKLTRQGPSYLHSWSPDGQFLIYTAQRNDEWDIYRIPSAGGDEVRITRAPGLDDGSEYTRDGKYIYFNSSRTGKMQIWRVKADGSDPEQVTNDGYNDWFPHFSPDGKSVVIISYRDEVEPDDHPFYKHVYLRMFPIEGGKPRVIAYLYGGQGTINVPSWSPDSKQIAFVSNTIQDVSE